jgi:hypothetical protein
MMIQQPADGCTGLSGLSDHRAKATRQYSLRRPISTDNIEAAPKRAIECRCDNRTTGRDLPDDLLTFRLRSPKPQNFERNY